MENLIFDISLYKGEDTLFYPLRGYRVVAVDADPDLINEWQNTFKKYIENGKLLLLDYVISGTDNVDTDFYIGLNTIWSSTKVSIPLRVYCKAIGKKIRSRRLDHLSHEYGTPLYCRMDMEGNDIIAPQTMEKVSEKPLYISVEAERVGEDEGIAGHELDTLSALYRLGYRKFKLVDQRTFTILDRNCFYKSNSEHDWFEQIGTGCRYAEELIAPSGTDQRVEFTDFFPGSSGPFGEKPAGK